jgi:hypothetical protein
MSFDARRFAGLHLAGYLRDHGYEGAEEPRREIALVPTGAAVGPGNEQLLLELARRGMVVQRPSPTGMHALHQAHADGRLVYLGTMGQIDPTRGDGVMRRVTGAGLGSLGLVIRRVGGKPILWLRRNTLRPKRAKDPVERLLAPLFRLFAREVEIEEVPELVDGNGARG